MAETLGETKFTDVTKSIGTVGVLVATLLSVDAAGETAMGTVEAAFPTIIVADEMTPSAGSPDDS